MTCAPHLRTLRDTLYDFLLGGFYFTPKGFVRQACDAWTKVVGASFGEVWLHNDNIGSWELLYTSYSGERDLPHAFSNRHSGDSRPIVDFACDSRTVTFVKDLSETRRRGHQSYSVVNRDVFVQAGYTSFLCVPLLSPEHDDTLDEPSLDDDTLDEPTPDNDRPPNIDIRGCICLHFDKSHAFLQHDDKALNLMSRLTSLALLRSYESQQRDILLALNGISETHSVDDARTPRQVRAAFVTDLLQCMKRYMQATGVSIFFHTADRRYIHCLGTTGLCDADRRPISHDRLESCRYHHEEKCWSSTCYRTGATHVATPEDAAKHSWKYTEFDPANPEKLAGTMGSVICPMLSATQSDGYPSLGIIRCSGLKKEFGTACGTVNSIGMQTLGLIAQQVGPFLEGMASRIQREETISLLKHDMYTPLNIIWNTAHDLETLSWTKTKNDSERLIQYRDLMNIKLCAHLARTMVPLLSFDPGEVKEFRPVKVELEQDIVDPIRQILYYYAQTESRMLIRCDGIRSFPSLYVDRTAVERALFNVVVNAIKYGEEKTVIHIKGVVTPEDYRIVVENEGMGISDEDAPFIFDLGFRSEAAKEVRVGVGHGLYVSQRAMRMHGGDIVVESCRNPTRIQLIFPQWLEREEWSRGTAEEQDYEL